MTKKYNDQIETKWQVQLWEMKIVSGLLGQAQLGKAYAWLVQGIYHSPNPSIGPKKTDFIKEKLSNRLWSISIIN